MDLNNFNIEYSYIIWIFIYFCIIIKMLSHKVEDKKNSKSYFPEVNILSFN